MEPTPDEFLARFIAGVKAARKAAPALNPMQLNVVLYIAVINPGATPSALCAEFDFEATAMSKLLKALTDDGLIGAELDAADRRIRHYFATGMGWRVTAEWLHQQGLPGPQMDGVRKFRPPSEPKAKKGGLTNG